MRRGILLLDVANLVYPLLHGLWYLCFDPVSEETEVGWCWVGCVLGDHGGIGREGTLWLHSNLVLFELLQASLCLVLSFKLTIFDGSYSLLVHRYNIPLEVSESNRSTLVHHITKTLRCLIHVHLVRPIFLVCIGRPDSVHNQCAVSRDFVKHYLNNTKLLKKLYNRKNIII